MAWTIKYADSAARQLQKLDKQIARQLVLCMDTIAELENPSSKGKALQGALGGLWRFRVNDWRVICEIQHKQIVILVLRTGHRKSIY